ncbi:MAG: hypothetical protein U0930_03325 [Pirellulales bacterium]
MSSLTKRTLRLSGPATVLSFINLDFPEEPAEVDPLLAAVIRHAPLVRFMRAAISLKVSASTPRSTTSLTLVRRKLLKGYVQL